MLFLQFESLDSFTTGFANIKEPTKGKRLTNPALVITPAVAAHVNGHRIGYGAGYYDRFIHKHPEHIYVTITLEDLIISQDCFEEHDMQVQFIITEKRIII
jgi:5-formyltetrahydrofolate cyclo-ligase